MGNTGNSNQKERPTVYCSHHGKSPTLDVPDYLMNFSPKLDILPEPQRAIWTELKTTPEQFVLYGGTALALRLGHRVSEDFDCLVDRNGSVPVSFFGGLGLNRVADPDTIRDNGVQIASLLDVAGCKMAVVQRRAEAKDYRDIAALLENGVDLSKGLAAAKAISGEQFEPATTLRALSYFADGDLPKLPKSIQNALQSAAKSVKLNELPRLTAKQDLAGPGGER